MTVFLSTEKKIELKGKGTSMLGIQALTINTLGNFPNHSHKLCCEEAHRVEFK